MLGNSVHRTVLLPTEAVPQRRTAAHHTTFNNKYGHRLECLRSSALSTKEDATQFLP
jgi:hypothetical protein